MENTKEVWKDIPGYEGRYMISNMGRVKSLSYHSTGIERVMKVHPCKGNYIQAELTKNGKQRHLYVALLVWSAFNGPIPEGMQVNHINEDKSDNRLENLNLMTRKENINWGTGIERSAKSRSKWVIQLSRNDEILHFFPSTKQAYRETGVNFGHISSCCNGKRKTAGGYKWKYAI